MLKLIDASNNNGPVNWSAVKSAGYVGGIVKVTQGTDFYDGYFEQNWRALTALGMVKGAYHFADMGDPVREAHWCVSHVPSLDTGDMVWLDQEPITSADGSWFALPWLRTAGQLLGWGPSGIYSYPSYIDNLKDPALAAWNLWMASLSKAIPRTEGVFKEIALWQDDWHTVIPGTPGEFDEDLIARTVAGLKLLGKPAPATPPAFPSVWRRGQTVCQGTVALKVQPSHTCAAVSGADKIADGQAIAISNDVRHTDDSWVYCQWKADYGFLLTANVKAS